MKIKFSFPLSFLIIIIFFGSFMRFFNPLWDNGLFLHPDERLFINASNLSFPTSLSQFFSVNSPLNPHMFYYGSLLLYLYKLASLISPLSLLVTSRLISAFFSSLTISFVFLIGKRLFSTRIGIFSSLIFACSVGSIQYAHFNTTESLLTFFISVITYIDILAVQKKNPKLLLFSLLLVGLATATKITGLLYGLSPLLAGFLLFKEKVTLKKILIYFLSGIIAGGILSILLTPYQIIDLHTFLIQQSYMQSATYGVVKPPFVLIYQHTIPYLYQVFHIFPFYIGFVSFPLSLIGCYFLFRSISKDWKKHTTLFFLFIFPLLYFAWSGSWYAKFARYYILMIPFMSVWAAVALNKLPKAVQSILIFFILCNALLFMQIYTAENTRITSSRWIYSHLPNNSLIATEHWDDALPLSLPGNMSTFQNIPLHVYDPEDTKKLTLLSQNIAASDYIVLSSRRVYVSVLENKILYPSTGILYDKLFSKKLGFTKIYEASRYPFFFSDAYADETFQSYDHPPVMIFQNKNHFSASQILSLITSE